MSEVRQQKDSNNNIIKHQYGLYATKEYNAGDVILIESSPFIQLSLSSLTQNEQEWVQEMIGNELQDSKLIAMVQVAFCFVCYVASLSTTNVLQDDPVILELLQLYHPSQPEISKEEQMIVDMSRQAFDFIQTKLQSIVSNKMNIISNVNHVDSEVIYKIKNGLKLLTLENGTTLDNESNIAYKLHDIVQDIMLIWACNAFDGGRIYRMFSRINHSCDPNSVVQVRDDDSNSNNDEIDKCNNNSSNNNNNHHQRQILIAATNININEEITISYLHGPLLYSDCITRQHILLNDKYFKCHCIRCYSIITSIDDDDDDVATAIPCPICHPREVYKSDVASTSASTSNIILSEDVQYDDEQDVHYIYPIQSISTKQNELESKVVTVSFHCKNCNTSYNENTPNNKHIYNKMFITNQTIIDKVIAFFRQPNVKINQSGSTMTSSKNSMINNNDDDNNDNDNNEIQSIYIEQLDQLLRLCSTVLGAKHWTTNMLLLYQLDITLSTFHTKSILKLTKSQSKSNAKDDDDDDDIETTIAEAIDMLQRIERYVVGVQLKLHIGHLLSNVIIGIARALVSLGDVKSQKYAAKWIDKIITYVNQFEPIGIQTVVHKLHIAWQRQDTTDERPDKRIKR